MPASVAPSVGQRPRHGLHGAPNSACCGDQGDNICPDRRVHNPSALFRVPNRRQSSRSFTMRQGRQPSELHVGAHDYLAEKLDRQLRARMMLNGKRHGSGKRAFL
jgi:hypothetical protein